MRTFPFLFDIMSIKIRTLCTCFFVLFSIYHSSNANNNALTVMDPPTLMLQFETNQGCGDMYCAVIQAKVKEPGEELQIGTSSVFVEYNPGALDFVSYTSLHFDEEDTVCVSNLFSPWLVQGVDGDEPGKVNIVMTLSENLKEYSCPIITSDEWIDVGVICFNVLSDNMPANLAFSTDPARTNFNVNDPNDGSITVPVDYDNLLVITESPQNEINAPVITNFSTTNELCIDGTGQPSSLNLGFNGFIPNGFVPIWQKDGVDLPIYNTIDVDVSDFSFNPNTFVLYVGDTVRWTNSGGNHNINGTQAAFPSNPVSFSNGAASSSNWVYEQAFNTDGVYFYQSDPDVNVNMTGSFTVYQNNSQVRIIDEPGTYTTYLRSLNDPSCISEVSNGIVITERDCSDTPEPTCPFVDIVNDEQTHCNGEFNGPGLVLNWRNGITISSDPFNTAGNIIISGSPVGSTGFPTAEPSGSYDGNGCAVDVQSFYAAVECDLDNDGAIDSYVEAGEFILNIYPTPQSPTIESVYNASNQICSFNVNPACSGDSLVYDVNALSGVACSDDNLSDVSITVFNDNSCSASFTVSREICGECSGGGCNPVTSNEQMQEAFCTGAIVNLNDFLTNAPGSFAWSQNGNNITNAANFELTASGCSNNTIIVDGYYTENVTGCVDEYFVEITFTVYPEITGSLQESDCSVELNDVCSNYEVIWTDDLGNSGNGTTYTADFTEAGNVAFIVTNPAAIGDCSSVQFQGVFNCNDCPTEVIHVDPRVLPLCADEEVNLNDYWLEGEGAAIDWYDEAGNAVVDGLITFENNSCESISAVFDGFHQKTENGCVIDYEIHLILTIYPNQQASISTNGCEVSLENVCDLFDISWSLEDGTIGKGGNFVAEEGTSGVVKFILINQDGQCKGVGHLIVRQFVNNKRTWIWLLLEFVNIQ